MHKKSRAMNEFSTIILGAGLGKRMYSKTPKVLHKILGKTIISFVIDKVKNIKCAEIIVVIGKNRKNIEQELGNAVKYAVQPIPLGTGDAAKKVLKSPPILLFSYSMAMFLYCVRKLLKDSSTITNRQKLI